MIDKINYPVFTRLESFLNKSVLKEPSPIQCMIGLENIWKSHPRFIEVNSDLDLYFILINDGVRAGSSSKVEYRKTLYKTFNNNDGVVTWSLKVEKDYPIWVTKGIPKNICSINVYNVTTSIRGVLVNNKVFYVDLQYLEDFKLICGDLNTAFQHYEHLVNYASGDLSKKE
jgi:hypothetical protein